MKKIVFIFFLVLFFIVGTSSSKAQWTRINFTDTLYQEPLRTRYIVECNNELFAMVDGIGLYRSADEGISWDQLKNVNTNIRKVYSANNTLFYDTWDYKFFRSTDNGNTWNSIDNSFLNVPVLPPPNDLTQYMVINTLTANSYYIFMGTGAGIFRSGDNGITWTSCSTGLPNDYYNVHFIEVTSLLIIDQYLFAGTIYQGVFLSTNNGGKWESISEGLPAGEFDLPSKSKIQNLCSVGLTIFASVNNHGIYKQNIGGIWGPVNDGISVTNIQSVQNMNSVLYAISTSALYQSINYGSTWEVAYNGSYFDSGVLIEMFLYNSKIYLADNEIGIYMSSDSGITWVLRNEGISKSGIRYPNKIDAYNSVIGINCADNKRFITTDIGNTWNDFIINDNTINNYVPNDTNFFRLFEYRYLKRNANDTWKRIFGPNSASRKINDLIAIDTFIIAAANDGIWRTGFNNDLIFSNNGNKQNWNLSLAGIECYNLIVNSGRIFAGTSNGIYLSTDKGSGWNQIGLKNNPVKRIISLGSIFLAFTSDGINKSLYKSLDGGNTWIYLRIGLDNISDINLCNDNLVALTYLYKDGKIWKRPFKETITYQRKAASFPLNIGNKWYYQGGFFEANNDYDGFYGTVKEVTDTLSNGFREINSTYFYPNKVSAKKEYWGFINGKFYYNTVPQVENANILYSSYLTYDSSYVRGIDYYEYWQFMASKIFNISDTALKYRESWGGHYGGGSNTFIVFPQIGITKTWYSLTNGIYGGTTYDDSTYLIGMLRDGEMLGDTIFNIAAGVGKVNIPEQYSLSQNYPNPFNPTTTIRYQIPKSGFVSLKVYDILGKVVATLVNEEKPPGRYEFEFNGDNLTSGVYFYKLESGGNIIAKKLLLLK